ncbi:MAG: DUF1624 domain-containing protein [Verrucomicrobia bacterium]|nr:DUF1624 domain-containing protein [Verrucomicrobiota bacterium]
MSATVSEVADKPVVAPGSARLMSLDVFRGITIAGMMLVNNPGSWGHVYPPFKHAAWHGWTFTDVIFPFFLWIVGVAIPLSLVRRVEEGESKALLFTRIFRRSLILFGLGLFLSGFPFYNFAGEHWVKWETYRIFGVLQRIGVCYLIASTIVLFTKIRGQIIWAAFFLISYWLIMAFNSMPGFPRGDLSVAGNFAHWVDMKILGTHVWGAKSGKTWDPEGIISTLPAIASCLLGVLTGHLLRAKMSMEEKSVWILVGGAILMWGGSVMDIWLPINKPLWTSSYAVFMAGLAMVVFGVCYWLVDRQKYQTVAKPFAIYGMNAITVFVLAGLLGRLSLEIKVQMAEKKVALKTYLFDSFFKPIGETPYVGSFLWSLMYVALLYLVAYVLYRKKWFIRF